MKKKRGKIYVIKHRRRREGKTDYRKRLKLLLSGKPRVVVRKSLNNTTCQLVKYKKEGDIVLASSDSRELKKFGWKFHGGSTPAAYLAGFLLGKRMESVNVKECIADFGLHKSTRGGVIYAAIKGLVDAGISIPHEEKMIPGDERIKGMHIVNYARKLREENNEAYRRQFSSYLKKKLNINDMPKIFEEVKGKIERLNGHLESQ